jgi:hypothetical protein
MIFFSSCFIPNLQFEILQSENSILTLAGLKTVLTIYLEFETVLSKPVSKYIPISKATLFRIKCGIQWLPVMLGRLPEEGISDDKAIRFEEILLRKQQSQKSCNTKVLPIVGRKALYDLLPISLEFKY